MTANRKHETSRSTRKLLATALIGCVGLLCAGCVARTNQLVQQWTVRQPGAEAQQASPPEDRILRPGMSKEDVERIAGDLLDKRHADTWVLKGQFVPFQPGIYPHFDSRQIILYFDASDKLAAIVEQGEYNVYP